MMTSRTASNAVFSARERLLLSRTMMRVAQKTITPRNEICRNVSSFGSTPKPSNPSNYCKIVFIAKTVSPKRPVARLGFRSQAMRAANRKVLKHKPTYQVKLVVWRLTISYSLILAAIPDTEIAEACERFKPAARNWPWQERAFGLLNKAYSRRPRLEYRYETAYAAALNRLFDMIEGHRVRHICDSLFTLRRRKS
jgi:hypothetical protein